MRPDGYYWLLYAGKWIMGEWDSACYQKPDGGWWIIGSECAFSDQEFELVGPMLEEGPPAYTTSYYDGN